MFDVLLVDMPYQKNKYMDHHKLNNTGFVINKNQARNQTLFLYWAGINSNF